MTRRWPTTTRVAARTVIGLDEKALVVRRYDREPLTVPREAITRLDARADIVWH